MNAPAPRATTHQNTHALARIGPLVATHDPALVLDVDALLDDPARAIIVCCGSGGVGKTTTSAALALRAAERGRKVVVLTIDPARRLAQSMGIEALDNTPRPVPGVDPAAGGSLDAMMLDMKRTFDEVVQGQASPEKAAQILSNPFYIAVSSSFAGTQEYMAMEKLGQLDKDARRSGRWDLIIVDTPPSRSALDFLDAPERLSSFLDGRFMKLLLAPARGPARLMTAGFGMVTNAVTKIIGAQVLQDMKAFVAAFDTLFGGFRQRAQRTFELLQDRRTAFLVIAAPEPDALREAAYFVERLRQERMPLAGLVVNRASSNPPGDLSANAAMTGVEKLRSSGEDHGLAAGLLRLHADRKVVVERETRLTGRFATSHPDVPTAVLPALSTDVHDLEGLRRIGDLLGAQVGHPDNRPDALDEQPDRSADPTAG
ncbi:MAG: arsenite efflux ATP-binding protein ArsA [Acidimicrobiales bacterium]|jgi:anion-transporting  ArsA/GET3 family ATPase|nr:arsenite efflux ATP-binding protein ArsA [Acidimicrobiales bacterium]